MGLSVKNGWLDEQGRVYIIFPVQEVMDALGCADNKATKLFRELKKFGLIERKRRGLGKPNLIYVKNFADPRFRNREKNGSGAADSAQQETAKSRGNKTEWNKNEGSEPDPFSSDAEDEPDERTRLEAYFMQSLEVDLLLRVCPDEEDTIDQIVNLLVDTCSSKRRMLRVAGDDKPAEVVRGRFMKLNADHAERKEKSENPPQLYDLTTLQRDANRLLGFTAQQTLNYAQSLYEKRLITYPRTDSRFLTEDMAEALPGLASGTAAIFDAEKELRVHVQQVINGSKVTDHHALLPTASVARADLSALPAGEMSILRLIAARLLCAVGEPYRYAETVLTTICAGEEFSAKGKVVLDEGWKSIERRVLGDLLSKKKEPAALPDVQRQSRSLKS